jgi:hypothetical protein
VNKKAKYLLIASMDVDAEHEVLFNEVYDQEHIPNLRRVPGVLGTLQRLWPFWQLQLVLMKRFRHFLKYKRK